MSIDAVTPGEFKAKGTGMTIYFGDFPTAFGNCLIGVTERGICWLSFYNEGNRQDSCDQLSAQYSGAEFLENRKITEPYVRRIFSHEPHKEGKPVTVFLKGTNFQVKVWEALLRIPAGTLTTYETIAKYINRPKSVRAVANAIGYNPVSYVIPCHRVLRKTGAITGYRWGPARKKAILAWETAHMED